MGKEKTKRNSVVQKTINSMLVFTLLLTIAVSVAVSYGFYVLSTRHYVEDTNEYACIAANVIEGDTVAEYLETGVKDEYYNNIESFLTAFRDEVDLSDISVIVPDGDEVVYIWDTGGGEGDFDLGDRTDAFGDYIRDYISNHNELGSDKAFQFGDTFGEKSFICSFASLYDSNGNTAAIVSVARPPLKTGTIISQFILAILTASAFVSAIMMLFIYRGIEKRFLVPINKLTESAGEMVENIERDRAMVVDVHTNDELETLAEAFTKMDIDLRNYIEVVSTVAAERERISGELDAAAKIQKGILPKKGLHYDDMPEFDLAASMTPAREVGGDFYDIFMADDRHLALVIADVSGKGVPASLFMVATKLLLKYSIKQGMTPAEVFRNVNEKLIESNDMELFVTAWMALIDLDTGECKVVNAGHEHPAFRHKGGFYELIRYKHSPALATLEGLTFKEREFKLEPGDSLYVYTDGVTEATNSENKLFGEDRLVMALNKDSNAAPDRLIEIVRGAIKEFTGRAPQFDDITMLAFRYNGKQDKE